MAVAIVAKWTAKAGQESAVREALAVLARASRQEPGCRLYVVHQEPGRALEFRLFEVYDDEDAIRLHIEQPHIAEFAKGLAGSAVAHREHLSTIIVDM